MYFEYALSVVNLFVSCTLQVLLLDEESSAYFFQHSFSLRQKMLETCINFFVGEAYLGPGETSVIKLFREDSKHLEAVKYFRKKAPPEIFVNAIIIRLSKDFFWRFCNISQRCHCAKNEVFH